MGERIREINDSIRAWYPVVKKESSVYLRYFFSRILVQPFDLHLRHLSAEDGVFDVLLSPTNKEQKVRRKKHTQENKVISQVKKSQQKGNDKRNTEIKNKEKK